MHCLQGRYEEEVEIRATHENSLDSFDMLVKSEMVNVSNWWLNKPDPV